MSPRPYNLGQRQVNTDQTRARINEAARDLLIASNGFTTFSIDAVAKQADVTRMTVYHHFGSKTGLLEALCDSLASSGGMAKMVQVFQQPDTLKALDEYIAVFGRFWEADRLVTRKLRALAALDPEFEQVIKARDERRRTGLRVLLQRLPQKFSSDDLEKTVNLLYSLISFEFFDMLAGPARSLIEVVPEVCQQAHLALTASSSSA
ncbi:MAG TPA: TetR/AcrR family transcriptional regulator [Chloroflexia bacterium]|nr:TetR/AcrR family transcriptional regulator [Chloroflexia bacterium]